MSGASDVSKGQVPRLRLESAAFVAGLILAPLAYAALAGPVEIGVTPTGPLLLAAGRLVGIGTRIGNGCTSGHGVCGIGRLSQRSYVATPIFMVSAVLTVWVVRHGMGG